MPLLRERTLVAAKLEAANGTAIALAGADSSFVAFDVESTVEAEEHDRPSPGTMSMLPSVIGGRRGTVTMKIELHGSGSVDTNPSWANVFLPALGMAAGATNAFALVSGAPGTTTATTRTITVGWYADGRLLTLAGCMGTGKFVFENGNRAWLEVTLTGKYVSTTDVALLAPTLPTVVPPRAANLTFTLGGANIGATNRLEIDLANTVVLREDISDGGGASGYSYALITNRRPMITVDLDARLVATKDIYGQWLAGTLQAFALSIGGSSWNQIDFAAPKAQILSPSPGDRDNIVTDSLSLLLTRSAANDDEFTTTFVVGS